MDGPAQTMNYMIGGYTVIFGVMFLYLGSLVVRWRRLRQDEELIKQLEDKDL